MTDEMKSRVDKTLANLRRNRIEAHYCDTKEDALTLLKTLLNPGDTVTHGGSETLKQIGAVDLLRTGDYRYLDRSAAGSPEEVERIYRESFSADVYLTSANAVTENGELYNVDGNSNRVAAILYGPKSVVFVCGVNKIVPDLDAAVRRIKTQAAPPNTVRLGIDTPCSKTGACVSLNTENPDMCSGCRVPGRICCNYAVCAYQRHVNRLKVILVGENLGY